MQSHHDEQTLLARIRAGEQGAVGELYDLYGGMLYALAQRYTHDAAEAEEIVLDVFTQAWRKAHSYGARRSNVMMWLVSLARQRLRTPSTVRHFTAASLG